MDSNALEICGICRSFRIGGIILGKRIMAVDNVSISLPSDRPWIISIVGESGSGKTTLANMILGLLDATSGSICLGDKEISSLKKEGKGFYRMVQPIFQNPFSAFNPKRMVDTYLYESAINLAGCRGKEAARNLITATLKEVGIEFEQAKGKYPNQFSGGELQRICIARALIPNPRFIVGDEPVAMIDASLRMNVVNLFKKLRDDHDISFIYITHDLSTAYYISDYIAVMYRGNIVEFGDAKSILQGPLHPYTRLLLDSVPKVGERWKEDAVMPNIESMEYTARGCRFAARCRFADDDCKKSPIEYYESENGHRVLCRKCPELLN